MTSTNAETRVSGYQAIRYGPNESVSAPNNTAALQSQNPFARPGDFILTHSSGMYGALVRFGEAIRYWGRDKPFARWSHAAIFVNDSGDIVEALGGGVQLRNISVYHGTEYVVVHLPQTTTPDDREQAIKFAAFCLRDRYGWLTIVSIALCLLFGGKLSFGVDGQQICSGLVARCIERIGEIFHEGDPWHLMPADLAKHFDVRGTDTPGRAPQPNDGVTSYSKIGGRQR